MEKEGKQSPDTQHTLYKRRRPPHKTLRVRVRVRLLLRQRLVHARRASLGDLHVEQARAAQRAQRRAVDRREVRLAAEEPRELQDARAVDERRRGVRGDGARAAREHAGEREEERGGDEACDELCRVSLGW